MKDFTKYSLVFAYSILIRKFVNTLYKTWLLQANNEGFFFYETGNNSSNKNKLRFEFRSLTIYSLCINSTLLIIYLSFWFTLNKIKVFDNVFKKGFPYFDCVWLSLHIILFSVTCSQVFPFNSIIANRNLFHIFFKAGIVYGHERVDFSKF